MSQSVGSVVSVGSVSQSVRSGQVRSGQVRSVRSASQSVSQSANQPSSQSGSQSALDKLKQIKNMILWVAFNGSLPWTTLSLIKPSKPLDSGEQRLPSPKTKTKIPRTLLEVFGT